MSERPVDQVWCTASGAVDGLPTTLRLTDAGLSVQPQVGSASTIPWHRVGGVEAQIGLWTGYLTIALDEGSLTVARVPRSDAQAFADALRARLRHRTSEADRGDAADRSPSDSPLAELERLGRLREAGVLTAEEFTEAKRTLLGRL
jgi:hypothetical protein